LEKTIELVKKSNQNPTPCKFENVVIIWILVGRLLGVAAELPLFHVSE